MAPALPTRFPGLVVAELPALDKSPEWAAGLSSSQNPERDGTAWWHGGGWEGKSTLAPGSSPRGYVYF